MGPPPSRDPWSQVADIEGQDLYRVLGLSRFARTDDIKKAYKVLARRLHPDKGGDARSFGRLQVAFETLCDTRKRAVYDEWATDLRFRYVDEHKNKTPGSESVLLDELSKLGVVCDPMTQLVLLCEVCKRPATKECWTCKMPICDFCTLKRHWKADFPLHWPLINSDHMRTRLAKRELEKKRVEDDKRFQLEDPNFRGESERQDIRNFQDAAVLMLERKDRLVAYDLRLARFYMWTQTDKHVYIVVSVPTGYADKELEVDCTAMGLRVQPQGSPAVIERAFDYAIDTSRPIVTFRTEDNRKLTIAVSKSTHGQHWRRLFRGDSDGARCMQPPYTLQEAEDSVIMEMPVPFWTDTEDVAVRLQPHSLEVKVGSSLHIVRACWSHSIKQGDSSQAVQAIGPEESIWSLDDEVDQHGEDVKVLLVHIMRPPLTESEMTYKRGKRQDNTTKPRRGSPQNKGIRFFEDDEDEFGLEDILQALHFWETGNTFVPAKPWKTGTHSHTVADVHLLSKEVQQHLERLLDEDERQAGCSVRVHN